MRRFNSYGPINTNVHYYAPRKELIASALTQLVGENPSEGGHYITVWAPRQTGKTWVMQEILFQLKKDPRFDVLKINLEILKDKDDTGEIINVIARKIGEGLEKKISGINNQDEFQEIFKKDVLDKPLILILDEFDALTEKSINTIVSAFRNIHISRMDEKDKTTEQKTYLLHAVALIGVRSVLGIENEKGSPFNIQRSVHISNLSFDEVKGMFKWYEKESGQEIEPAVVEKLYKETAGQPGLTCWMGEILTEGVENNPNDTSKPILSTDFENIYRLAINILPNNNILNIISKARTNPYRDTVINLFKTDKPVKFRFDDKEINYLYMNGVIEPETIAGDDSYVKFASPFVQKRLFNYFSGEIFKEMGQLVDAFMDVKEVVFPDHMDIPGILTLYQTYLDKNKGWLFKNAPRRSDLRIYEAVFHFNLYAYLDELLRGKKVRIFPEFPTGNGKIDLLLQYNNMTCGIELKSFSDQTAYKVALTQAAQYANRLGLRDIYLVSFIESIDDANKKKYETPFQKPGTGVTVYPVFIQTGKP
ncbi:MAG: AAA-like domain-containing protein [Candidatus Aminicenantes bacterium]|nr:AAA-like domain-containing protein [Candidatus Aminicenantes bacterium]